MYNQLPYYIILEIIQYIEPCKEDFANFRAVCQRFASITRDKRFNHLVTCGKCTLANVYDTDHIACLFVTHKRHHYSFILIEYIKNSKISNLDVVKFFMNNIEDSRHYYYAGIKIASAKGEIELFKLLFEKRRSNFGLYKAIIIAACRGHTNIVKFLDNEEPDISANNIAITRAIIGGHYDVVKFLIDKVDAKYRSSAIQYSASHGHYDITKFLIDKSSCESISIAIDNAAHNGDIRMVKMLTSYGTMKSNPRSWGTKKSPTENGYIDAKCFFPYIIDLHPVPFPWEGSWVDIYEEKAPLQVCNLM